jgi:hypothetical protein
MDLSWIQRWFWLIQGREVKDLGWRIEGAIQQAMRSMIALLPTNLVGLSAVNEEELKRIHVVTQGENSADRPMDSMM